MDSKKPSKIRVLNKLGSDNIHDILEPQGGKAITRTLSDEEFKIALFNKLQEEVTEFLEDPIAPSFIRAFRLGKLRRAVGRAF